MISYSYGIFECLKASKILKDKFNISAEVIDLRTIRPIDKNIIIKSVKKTKRVLVVDNSWKSFGVSAEIISVVTDNFKTNDVKKISKNWKC